PGERSGAYDKARNSWSCFLLRHSTFSFGEGRGEAYLCAKLRIMICIGLIRERKKLPDERVAFTPKQCIEVQRRFPGIKVVVQPSPTRCYTDDEYLAEGVELNDDLSG